MKDQVRRTLSWRQAVPTCYLIFSAVMINALPDPTKLRELVPQATGYAQDGLQRKKTGSMPWYNWFKPVFRVCHSQVSTF